MKPEGPKGIKGVSTHLEGKKPEEGLLEVLGTQKSPLSKKMLDSFTPDQLTRLEEHLHKAYVELSLIDHIAPENTDQGFAVLEEMLQIPTSEKQKLRDIGTKFVAIFNSQD